MKNLFLSLLVILILLAITGFSYFQLNKSPQINEPSTGGLYHQGERIVDSSSLRETQSGEVIGFADSYNTHAWLGIPYAKAPVGELRWRAPQPSDKWLEPLAANQYGSPCPQFWGSLAGVNGEVGKIVGQEDCLYLNIWAPQKTAEKIEISEKLPVMVWIHGGGNNSGTANTYQAHHLAGKQDVVVVLLNYRLGLTGWFSHQAIRDQANNLEDASGNFGTLDIIAGLQWVQDNISAFGGDPSNVTIFGESAGGKNVFSMLASPLASGLFHKAIAQSGSADTTLLTLAEEFPEDQPSKAISGLKNSSNALIQLALSEIQSEESGAQIRERMAGMSSNEIMEIMRSMPAEKLMKMAADNIGEIEYNRVARVIRDGHVIPKESVLDRLSQPTTYNAVPLITGANRDENKLFMMSDDELVVNRLGFLPRIKDSAEYERIDEYVSRNWKAAAVDEPAKRISSHGAAPVYAYRFDWDDLPNNLLADLPALLGAAHGFEISFVFGDFIGGAPLQPLLNKDNAPGRAVLSDQMMSYWAEFAYAGNPGKGRDGSLPEWSAWSGQGPNLMVFDSPEDQGISMQEIRDNVSDIKLKVQEDHSFESLSDRCEAYAVLFLHGYMASDFWNPEEYSQLGCDEYPAGIYREG